MFVSTTPVNPAAVSEASAAEASSEEGAETADSQTADPELDVTAQIPGLKVRITKPESDKTARKKDLNLHRENFCLFSEVIWILMQPEWNFLLSLR